MRIHSTSDDERAWLYTSSQCRQRHCSCSLSPESTLFVEYCTGGPSSTTPVLLSCVDSSDTAPPPCYPACLAPLCLLSGVDFFDTVSWAGMLGKQEGTSREHGRSAVSMETMDSYGFTCKGGAGPYARRGRQEEDQAQGACRWLPFRGSRDKSQRNHHRSKEEEQCIGDRQVGPEEEEQCRRSRHCSGGTGVPSKEEEQCRRSRHSSGGQEWC
ncbi:uncharacterized protein UDID_17348 [Ustilago sp. UG-2017a]|nr:uncharacterized protein UDID_17348 [Ustilago sp. UG-2017a]